MQLSNGQTKVVKRRIRWTENLQAMRKNQLIYWMLLPGMVYFIVFKYVPMWGILIAFQDYQPFLGMSGSPWLGFDHFTRFFSEPIFWTLFRNTVLIALYNIVFFFPLPIIVALMLNEVGKEWFKRTIQTLVYIPHFFSMVVVAGISYVLLTTEGGLANELIAASGGDKIAFGKSLMDSFSF